MSLKLNDKQLNSLLDEVASDLNKSFGSAKDKLSKAEGAEMVKDENSQPDLSAPEESSPVPESSEAPPPDMSAPVAPDQSAAPQDPAQEMGGQLTPEALQAEYEKLPPEELQMHMQACQAALAKLSGGMGPDQSAPPAPEAAPAPDMGAGAPPMGAMKSENEALTLAKKETELVKAEVASIKEDLEIAVKTLRTLIETPVRKAITSISDLPKVEQNQEAKVSYSNDEFWAKLKEVAKRSDLKKSDKKLITDIYDRRVDAATAAKHLAKLFSEE